MISLPTQLASPADQFLQQRVAQTLHQKQLTFACRLEIEAHRGVITLRGQVPSFHQRQLLYSYSRRVPGVTQVIDLLEVDPPFSGKLRSRVSSVVIDEASSD
ncbi:transport-associated [Pirellula staleyi DSM 6068]|uniref:Transport-associated n=1 Tax=Pirellula staleyi (strain ATCC 27377 / DSM 6068 / ICPB 4128) TaxID=530564 RepID=D2R4E4_PIRSD|nr:BON domain-containing protein [Pirellula staleyi]ADB15292.1 transport-associated [Pirellula staleyi DSM 6068]